MFLFFFVFWKSEISPLTRESRRENRDHSFFRGLNITHFIPQWGPLHHLSILICLWLIHVPSYYLLFSSIHLTLYFVWPYVWYIWSWCPFVIVVHSVSFLISRCAFMLITWCLCWVLSLHNTGASFPRWAAKPHLSLSFMPGWCILPFTKYNCLCTNG